MGVNSLAFGQQMPGRGDQFLRLKQKGDMVQFKIAQEPVYTGKHFTENADPVTREVKWVVTECPRIVSGGDCEICEKFFELKALVKKFKESEKADNDHPEVKRMNNEARKYAAAIQFFFPILDRGEGVFKIFQTTNGVRNKFNAQFEAGVAVLEKEWVVRNTGSANPGEIYSLTMVDSADVKPLTPDEEAEFEKAKAYDLSQISQSGDGDE